MRTDLNFPILRPFVKRSVYACALMLSIGGTSLAADTAVPTQLTPDAYFLSATNPLATADQRDLEALALKIQQSPAVQKAKENARSRWKILVGNKASPEAWSRFDAFLDEYVFHYTLVAMNSDPNYPRVLRYDMLPHDWFGMHVPGSRQGGGDNPDNTYALIPIDYGAKYELTGQRLQPLPADVTYSLMGNLTPTMTLGILEGSEVKADKSGKFVITLGPEPAAPGTNHIQTQPDSRYLFIRESRGDWRQVPSAIRIKRLTPPTMPPLTEEQLITRAAHYVIDDIPAIYWWIAIDMDMPRNEITPPKSITGLGGLVTQQTSFGHLQLADDDALVVTIGSGGAGYGNIVLHDFWYNTLEYAHHTPSMTDRQGVPNADGTTTYVISIKDPGVYNWLDPEGLHETLVVRRWQALPATPPNGKPPSLTAKLVKIRDLASALPAGMKMVTPRQRQEQLAQRLAEWELRFKQ